MKVLLDTHAFLWWIADDPQLSPRARRILGASANEVYFSAASGWEIAIKARLGRLSVAGADVESFVAQQVAANGFQVLPINLAHALKTYSLPDHHKDPFDRLLVAQAATEELALVSADRQLAAYKVRIVW
ncbi:MAG: type II toxin-antitoxin system VapC family toxin [Deltaproteobacteria bacterium]|nr:type II toxin-antitoxin system VapC family toxin [Deltaproteobacteria bacterium]